MKIHIKFSLALIVSLLVISNISPSHSITGIARAQANFATVTYDPVNTIITNPERGFLHTNSPCESDIFDLATLQNYRSAEHISLVLCNFYLTSFKSSAISQATLNTLQAQLNTIRSAGLKVVLRFSYTSTDNVDASLTQILSHIDQLAPILQSNSDVIYVWQAGFIGQWGEWYYTSHFGDQGVISAQQWADRKAVVEKMLQVLPSTRMVSLRAPFYKRTMYQAAAITPDQAFNGSSISRIGQFNDAFVSSPDDMGTYTNIPEEYPWLEAETAYLPMGGENNTWAPPRTNCTTALEEMDRFHWSYINIDYLGTTISNWNSQGCLDTMKKKLGYRFTLIEGTYPDTAQTGSGMDVHISIRNDGFAAPINPRPGELILRNSSSGEIYHLPLKSDPRFWTAGAITTIQETIIVPTNIPAGSYELLLNLPDAEDSLSSRPEYSIQLANANIWESATGFNNLLHTISISAGIPTTFADVPFDHPLHDYIEALYQAGYTAGCSTDPLMYCPDTILDRAQSAVFMLRGQMGSTYSPPPAPWDTFADDWAGFEWAEPWAEGMWQEGLTAGCQPSPLMYCPATQLPRVEASVFGLRMKYGVNYTPPAGTGTLFADMTDTSYWGIGWAEQAYQDGLLPACGTDSGTGKPLFCPSELLDRAWGAYLIVKAKNIPLP